MRGALVGIGAVVAARVGGGGGRAGDSDEGDAAGLRGGDDEGEVGDGGEHVEAVVVGGEAGEGLGCV